MKKNTDDGQRTDYVTSLTIAKRVEFGGFRAEMTQGGTILVSALAWKGVQQPRIVLIEHEPGYSDWWGILEASPERNEQLRFVGLRTAADNPLDQWLTHGSSDLLNQ